VLIFSLHIFALQFNLLAQLLVFQLNDHTELLLQYFERQQHLELPLRHLELPLSCGNLFFLQYCCNWIKDSTFNLF